MGSEKIEESAPIKRLKKNITSGNIWIYILSLLKKNKKVYAYALDKGIQEEFNFKTSLVMIYLVLYRLEGEGIIESKFEERRKYYTLTKKGEKVFENGKKILNGIVKRL
ncbi:MAG: helix-turn-helix transcriptional regulator [Candidatus ainarchaeum sp.]|nr:helix-turn-helix transcriptional regulator [Candidatus ainarchaeum sp.]